MSNSVKVKIINIDERNPLPKYAVAGSAGMDLYASMPPGVDQINLSPGAQEIIGCGIKVSIPVGYEIQLRSRSGLAANYSVCLSNGIGTIDSSYLDEIKAIVINHGKKTLVVKQGDRICQAVLGKVPSIEWAEVEDFGDDFNRGGGLGSTGVSK